MPRKIGDFRSEEELTEYINSIAWSESEDDGFSSDDDVARPEFRIDKPHPWGDKLFLMCDDLGVCYSFEIYSGDDDHRLENEPNLGACANVVVRLARSVPRFVNHTIYFDNYYTSIPLLTYLRTQGIYAFGTVRRQRVPLCKLSQKFSNRGESEEYDAPFHGIDVSTVAWNDNKAVNMAYGLW